LINNIAQTPIGPILHCLPRRCWVDLHHQGRRARRFVYKRRSLLLQLEPWFSILSSLRPSVTAQHITLSQHFPPRSKMVSLRSLVAGAALMAAPIMAALTPAQIADGLKSLTVKSQALQGPAQSITIVNAPLIIIGQGPLPVPSQLVPLLAFLLLIAYRPLSAGLPTSSQVPLS
jgi:hypothetical protein